jgi:hypothetical protein
MVCSGFVRIDQPNCCRRTTLLAGRSRVTLDLRHAFMAGDRGNSLVVRPGVSQLGGDRVPKAVEG